MFKKILIFSQILFSLSSFGQKLRSTDLNDKGAGYFNKKNYKAADSIYTASLELYPDMDEYYNLALIKMKLGDTCNYCHNLKKALLLGDGVANKYYNKICPNFNDRLIRFYKKSDSVYLSIVKTNPNPNAYFDLAITKAKFGNKCAYCQYLDSAAIIDVFKLRKLFKKSCCSDETIQIIDSAQKEFKIFNVISKASCTNERKECRFIKINQQNDTIIDYPVPAFKRGSIARVDISAKDGAGKITIYIDTISPNSDKINCNSNKINYIISEEMPSFPGGENEMYLFLNNNIKYPKVAEEKGISGNVIITFVVENDGSITGARILKDIGGGCGEEAVRVVKAMPNWLPGKQNEVPVRVQFNLPIRFTLQ